MLRGDTLLISKSPFVCQGLLLALAKDTLSVVGEARSPAAALSFLQSGHQHVDLIIFDGDAAEDSGLKAISERYPEIGIVILAANPMSIAYDQVAEVRPKALLPTTLSAEALNLTLQLVILGENLFLATGQATGGLRAVPQPARATDATSLLSPREAEILRFIKKGASNKIIARELGVADATVKAHVKSVLRKIEVSNRTQAAIWALDHLDDYEYEAA
jgi:two-component system nitrate/nitrite response regulator NarL